MSSGSRVEVSDSTSSRGKADRTGQGRTSPASATPLPLAPYESHTRPGGGSSTTYIVIDEKREPPTGVLSGRRAPRKATPLRAHSHPTRTPSRHPPPLGMSCDGRGAKAYVSAYRRAARGGVGPVPSRLEVRTSDKLAAGVGIGKRPVQLSRFVRSVVCSCPPKTDL